MCMHETHHYYSMTSIQSMIYLPVSSEAEDLINGLVEDIVHHDVVEELAAIRFFQFDLRVSQPQLNLLFTLCTASNEPFLLFVYANNTINT